MQSLDSRVRKAEAQTGPDHDDEPFDFRVPGGQVFRVTQRQLRRIVEEVWARNSVGNAPAGV
jgi:hypothetical protein